MPPYLRYADLVFVKLLVTEPATGCDETESCNRRKAAAGAMLNLENFGAYNLWAVFAVLLQIWFDLFVFEIWIYLFIDLMLNLIFDLPIADVDADFVIAILIFADVRENFGILYDIET